jgi:hypothetical protein
MIETRLPTEKLSQLTQQQASDQTQSQQGWQERMDHNYSHLLALDSQDIEPPLLCGEFLRPKLWSVPFLVEESHRLP